MTSTGVIETAPKDPLSQLLLTGKGKKNKNNRQLVHHRGKAVSRLEFSFYGDTLMKIQLYKEVIASIFETNKEVIDSKMFR